MLEKIFHLKENHTDVKTELMAGITTFMTMAYILAVNPNILSASGMDSEAVLIATALASFVGTALMALLANYPFALAPGMGLNAYFSYTVVLTMGYSWQLALMAVFVEGIIFIVLSLTNVREGIFNAIPMTLKSAVSVGIGLFVAFVGLQNAKLIVNSDSTLVTYQHFKGETFHSIGVGAILTLVGVLITAILLVKKVKGGILYGILITWVLGILCEIAGIYVPNPDAGMYSVIPTAFVSFDFSALGKTFGQVFKTDFSGVGILNFFAVMFSFLFVDLFDPRPFLRRHHAAVQQHIRRALGDQHQATRQLVDRGHHFPVGIEGDLRQAGPAVPDKILVKAVGLPQPHQCRFRGVSDLRIPADDRIAAQQSRPQQRLL